MSVSCHFCGRDAPTAKERADAGERPGPQGALRGLRKAQLGAAGPAVWCVVAPSVSQSVTGGPSGLLAALALAEDVPQPHQPDRPLGSSQQLFTGMFYRNGAAGAGKRHQGCPERVQQRQPELAPDRALYSDSTRSKELRERSSPRLSTKRVARSQVGTAARKPQGTSPSLAPAVQVGYTTAGGESGTRRGTKLRGLGFLRLSHLKASLPPGGGAFWEL